jgi:lysophospholipid acyltransferase (LPLAT)-like uncharacterized protein
VKKLLRSAAAQAFFAWLLTAYIGMTLASMRWRFENRAPADAAVAGPGGILGCFWHGRIAEAVVCNRVLKVKPRRVLISLSRDGEFIAQTVERLGFPAIRGSAGGEGATSAKGGAKAFVQAVKFMREGGVVAVTPDGPRGPSQVMPLGPVQLARAAGASVFLFGLAARPSIDLKSWDRTQIPLPFTRGCVVFDGPLEAPARNADAETLEAARLEWQTRLTAAQARAEAILAGA